MRRARWQRRSDRGRVRGKLSGGRTTRRGSVDQRQYCEAEGIPLKAFGNWRSQFKAEPQPPERKLLYRHRGLSPPFSPHLSPPLSPLLGPGTYPSSSAAGPIVPRPREGHRRRFSEADNRSSLPCRRCKSWTHPSAPKEASSGDGMARCRCWVNRFTSTLCGSLPVCRHIRPNSRRLQIC
jgi:hypothetical protein